VLTPHQPEKEEQIMTPDELADQARVDEWIASWNAKQILDYDEQVAKREELDRRREERERREDDGYIFPKYLKEQLAQHDFAEHIRRRFPVGTFFDSIKEDYDGDRRASSKQLMQVAEIGMQLFYAAISHIDATTEFLDDARYEWGALVDAVLERMDGSIERRDPVTGEFTVHVWPPESQKAQS
jgi:hypothetical protein